MASGHAAKVKVPDRLRKDSQRETSRPVPLDEA